MPTNIYCDESCHLENDHQPIMVLGALWCPANDVRGLSLQVRDIKRKHGLADGFEIKWGKVSPSKADFYADLIDLVFGNAAIAFRGLVVPNKAALRHDDFGQTHDHWYYKMYYLLLRPVLKSGNGFRAFLDIKDTQGGPKAAELESYLRAHLHDETHEHLLGIQLVHSREVVPLQLTDLLIGALSYVHRDLKGNAGKERIVAAIREKSGLTLRWATAPGRKKFDVFVWEANKGDA